MTQLIASSNLTLIIGLGATGLSVARYLQSQGRLFCLADEAIDEPSAQVISDQFPGVNLLCGPLQFSDWQGVSQIILSPGVPRKHPEVQKALAQGVSVIGDIELFARAANAPVVAITGSNGKSTVTTLVAEMAKQSGWRIGVGGNLGPPALDLLSSDANLYVLELSSFQLESTESLVPSVATVLNVSQDHLDRYDSYADYFLCKQKIYHRASQIVVNKDDPLTQPPIAEGVKVLRFGAGVPDLHEFGLLKEGDTYWLAHGFEKLISETDLRLRGKHNLLNALASLAIGHSIGFKMSAMLETLKQFRGLAHRCQLVCRANGVEYINDSKATNVGATIAALNGLHKGKNILLIAGGDGKGADFSDLKPALTESVKSLILFGRDAQKIAQTCTGVASITHVDSLQEAVIEAHREADSGDLVLLSPACASLDMFKNYQERGHQFCMQVEQLCQS